MPKPIFPSIEEIQDEIASDSYAGWCIVCGEWTHDSCEPDAHGYECPVCERRTCYGAEELLLQQMYQ